MKYLCLVYEEGAARETNDGGREVSPQEYARYEGLLRTSGQPVESRLTGGAADAVTLRLGNGKVSFGDGGFAHAEKFLGGVMVLEARDLNHAIQLMSRLPRTRPGGWVQIRPIDENVGGRDGGLR